MANESDPKLFNPLLWWTDLGMRATETAVSAVQSITDGADRVTRAVASAEPEDIAVDAARPAGGRRQALPPTGLDGMARMQRLAWESMTQQWTHWMSTIGNVMAAGSGAGLTRHMTGRDNPLESARNELRQPGWSRPEEDGSVPRRQPQAAPRRAVRASADLMHHALAANEAKPRRKTAAKAKRAARASRK